MANDVFLSYARTDIKRARQIKDLLEGLGLTVFFDTEGLDGGDVFPDVLDHEVKHAGAVVGVWSAHALSRPWVKIECDIGKTRGVLVPLQIETIADLDRPAAFWNIQFADLSDFDGDADHAGWLRFLRSLARTLDRPDLLERESAAQAATPDSQDASVRAELAALRAEMADMRSAKERAAAAPVKQVEITKIAPPAPRSKTPLIAGGVLIAALIAGVVGWQVFKPATQITSVPAAASALTESDGVAYHVEVCENGITAGCMSAATAYAYGEGVEVDRSLSLGYYDRGCDLGDMEACWVGGIVYEQDGELRVARALYDRACLGGAEDGCGLLKDLDEMTISDKQAAETAEADDAFYALLQSVGTITAYTSYLRDGRYTRHIAEVQPAVDKHEKGTKRLQRALQDKGMYGGAIDGQIGNRLLGSISVFNSETKNSETKTIRPEDLFSINSASVEAFAANVEAWVKPAPGPPKPSWAQGLTNAKAIGHAEGCIDGSMVDCSWLGYMYHEGKDVTQDYVEARRLYTKACNSGHMGSCVSLGSLYVQALGVTQDYAEARRLYTKACNGGEITGCYSLGMMYEFAQGVTQDYDEARRLYTKACNGGLPVACDDLTTLPN